MKNFVNLILVSIVAVALVIGCGNKKMDEKPTAEVPNKTTDQAPSASETSLKVQARVLTKDYEENELAADKKYKDKLLEVSGKITNIAETLGNVTVQFEGHKLLETVMCSFTDAERENVANLKKGQSVTVIGRGDGKTSMLYVGLIECRIK